ncbi:MAG TPA: IS110 family transposase [Niabella sp.]|nr:IS110 family transposase [Niabella sp.]
MEKIFIGIDVSKETLDICIKTENTFKFEKIENNVRSVKNFFKRFKSQEDKVIISMENTGRYNTYLYDVLGKLCFSVYVVNPLHIKKSIGLVRGKDDRTDAKRIAWFIEKNYKELPLWEKETEVMSRLKVLQTVRKKRINIKANLRKEQADSALMKSIGMDKKTTRLNNKLIAELDRQIKAIEAQIEELVKQDKILNEQAERIRTVPGVGKVLCWMMISKTQGFTRMQNPRKMACYAGVVPFDYQSGTSVRYRPQVSVFADKDLKRVLHMAAMSAIQSDNEISRYYVRKVDEGKNKMLVLNAVRNKIIHRIFAVIKNQTFYQKDLLVS